MPYREINSKLIIDLNVNYKTINFLEGDMEEIFWLEVRQTQTQFFLKKMIIWSNSSWLKLLLWERHF